MLWSGALIVGRICTAPRRHLLNIRQSPHYRGGIHLLPARRYEQDPAA